MPAPVAEAVTPETVVRRYVDAQVRGFKEKAREEGFPRRMLLAGEVESHVEDACRALTEAERLAWAKTLGIRSDKPGWATALAITYASEYINNHPKCLEAAGG